ncbi:MAG TPA: alpha/beta hydrolase, partial [Gemmatimonadaceae bacterium]
LPPTNEAGYVEHEGACIWYAAYGEGEPVILLHGGLGHSGNWGYQIPALLTAGCRTIVIDSRGHGRSTRDARPYSYELMAGDVRAVMDALDVRGAALAGWSDGACVALILGRIMPERVAGVLFFGCNMDPSGTRELTSPNPVVDRCFARHREDYAALSATTGAFESLVAAVSEMHRTQPNYTPSDLADVHVPVLIAHAEHDEFIRREHAEYLARSIPNATLVLLPDVSHFAPLQRPETFDALLTGFLRQCFTSTRSATSGRWSEPRSVQT